MNFNASSNKLDPKEMVVAELLGVVIGITVVKGYCILKGHFPLFPALSVTVISILWRQQEPLCATTVALYPFSSIIISIVTLRSPEPVAVKEG